MALFIARHRHSPETCTTFVTRSGLLSRVSAGAAARQKITIEAEALVDQDHLLVLVVDALSQSAVEGFLDFLHAHGHLDVLPASTLEETAARGGCWGAEHAEDSSMTDV